MVSGVILGLFIIPVLFVIFQHLQERVTGVPLAVLLDRPADENIDNVNVLELQGEYSE